MLRPTAAKAVATAATLTGTTHSVLVDHRTPAVTAAVLARGAR